MPERKKVNILLVDDQPGKLLSYEVILTPLGENLIRASSAREALAELLKSEVAVILIDVQMPDLDGFELAAMIREHPRFQSTAIIFVSAVYYSKDDTMRGYAMGAVDYVTVPVIPEVLRAKVQVFVDLYRKTRQLERFNSELEQRVDDRTAELEAAMKRQAILAREVDHRAKNMLAVVQSIVRLSRANSVGEYALALEGRIGALGRTHALLSESHWEGANLAQIIEDELVPYVTGDSAQLTIAGPRIMLEPAAAQSLTLVIHELATNAAKYGSLSSPEGRLSVNFEMQPETLVLHWDESGGPGIAEPKEAGFGSKLITTCMTQLRGSAKFDWARDGLKFSLTAARGPELELVDSDMVGNGLNNATAGRDIGPTALLVEDEPLVGMMIADLLTELQFQVLGPFARTEDAIAAAKKRSVQVAVLDINLAGKLVYPVASYLRASGVPFIFVSGYAADGIDERFSEVPMLQKPVDKEELFQKLRSVTKVAALS